MNRLLILLVLLGAFACCYAQRDQGKAALLDGAKVKPRTGDGYKIEANDLNDLYRLKRSYGSDRYRIENDRNLSDTYTVKPRGDGSYRIENDRVPGESYKMKPRGDGSYRIESDSVPIRRQSNTDQGSGRNPWDFSSKRPENTRDNGLNDSSKNRNRWDDTLNKNDRDGKKKNSWER